MNYFPEVNSVGFVNKSSKLQLDYNENYNNSFKRSSVLVGFDWVYPDIDDPMTAWRFPPESTL